MERLSTPMVYNIMPYTLLFMFILAFSIIVLLFSIVIHEVSHGEMAYKLGDPTAKYAGRLTLNPVKHLDPIGSVILPLLLILIRSPFVIGWAKPVPINPYNFRDQRWDQVKVAMAGPGANLSVALFFGGLMRFFKLPYSLLQLFGTIVAINLLLGFFNLVPIPPLDGSRLLFAFLPQREYQIKRFLKRYGILLLLLFLMFGLDFLFPAVSKLYGLITAHPIPF